MVYPEDLSNLLSRDTGTEGDLLIQYVHHKRPKQFLSYSFVLEEVT